jgi:hypothetical protein
MSNPIIDAINNMRSGDETYLKGLISENCNKISDFDTVDNKIILSSTDPNL